MRPYFCTKILVEKGAINLIDGNRNRSNFSSLSLADRGWQAIIDSRISQLLSDQVLHHILKSFTYLSWRLWLIRACIIGCRIREWGFSLNSWFPSQVSRNSRWSNITRSISRCFIIRVVAKIFDPKSNFAVLFSVWPIRTARRKGSV